MAPNERYPTLDEIETCQKCGQEFDDHSYPVLHYGCKSETTQGQYIVMDEWIRRTCPTCSFQWRENVKA